MVWDLQTRQARVLWSLKKLIRERYFYPVVALSPDGKRLAYFRGRPGQWQNYLLDMETGEERQLTDTGRGNVTGRWSDLGRFKTPTLRGLAARAPYFHNGSAATLADVVSTYNTRLNLGMTAPEMADLVEYLKSL